MSKKRGQTETERARIARALVEYMLDEVEEEPQNPAIDPEQLPDAVVPEQTTGVDNVNEQVEHDQHQSIDRNADNGLEFLASVLAAYPDLAPHPIEALVPDVAASAVPEGAASAFPEVATSAVPVATSIGSVAAPDLTYSPHSAPRPPRRPR